MLFKNKIDAITYWQLKAIDIQNIPRLSTGNKIIRAIMIQCNDKKNLTLNITSLRVILYNHNKMSMCHKIVFLSIPCDMVIYKKKVYIQTNWIVTWFFSMHQRGYVGWGMTEKLPPRTISLFTNVQVYHRKTNHSFFLPHWPFFSLAVSIVIWQFIYVWCCHCVFVHNHMN